MRRLEITLAVLLLFPPSLAVCREMVALPADNYAASSRCSIDILPSDIQRQLSEKFHSWRLQESKDLVPSARVIWSSAKRYECPGISAGHFTTDGTLAYASLLVPIDSRNMGLKLVIFRQKVGALKYDIAVVGSWSGNVGSFFIRSMPIGQFFDKASKQKFHAHAPQIILLVDSGKNEYEADAYYWADGRFHKTWVDY